MRYQILDIELTKPLPTVATGKQDNGLALILRYGDCTSKAERPIGFVLLPMQPNCSLSEVGLNTLLSKEVGAKLLQEKIRQDLIVCTNTEKFPSLTVAICTKDRPDNVKRCLNSLLNLQLPNINQPAKFEILVVDNAPSDERTHELVKSMASVGYTREPKPGLDFARNRAVQEAKGELLAFLDDDVVVDRQWLRGLQEAWAENPDAGAFTGLVLPYELETEAQIIFEHRGGFRRGFEKIRYQGSSLDGNPLYPCGAGIFGAGCNMAFRREVLLKLGGFDEALDTGKPLPGGGDLDIFYRVIRAGYPLVYEPQYLIYHQHRQEIEKLQHQYWSWGAGFMAFVIKSFQQDVSQRAKLISLILWWFQYQLQQLADSYLGTRILPPSMVWAEIWGGIQGLFGEYQRSQRRVEKIRKANSESSKLPQDTCINAS
ncbi:MAG: glycosyltransferase [Rivularia sp. (in: Bacteria)]|nr:glycosyltransferase [Rivularia sp. MS3]